MCWCQSSADEEDEDDNDLLLFNVMCCLCLVLSLLLAMIDLEGLQDCGDIQSIILIRFETDLVLTSETPNVKSGE